MLMLLLGSGCSGALAINVAPPSARRCGEANEEVEVDEFAQMAKCIFNVIDYFVIRISIIPLKVFDETMNDDERR